MAAKNKVIRVGVMNNFGFTRRELEALQKFQDKGKIFVNSNSFNLIKSDYPSIITVNPYLTFVPPQGDLMQVKACRIKMIAGATWNTDTEQTTAIRWSLAHHIPVLITYMRFRRKETMAKYVRTSFQDYYRYNSGWLRPMEEGRAEIKRIVSDIVLNSDIPDAAKLVFYCDDACTGCVDCCNCIRLTYGKALAKKAEVWSLNLSESGDDGRCIYNCVDCFAKEMLAMTKNRRPLLDTLKQNRKQLGLTKHA